MEEAVSYTHLIGMLNDDTVLMKQNKLAELTKRLLQDGFDVYITADHGNTPCTGPVSYTHLDLIIIDEAHRVAGSSGEVARYKLGNLLAQASPYPVSYTHL